MTNFSIFLNNSKSNHYNFNKSFEKKIFIYNSFLKNYSFFFKNYKKKKLNYNFFLAKNYLFFLFSFKKFKLNTNFFFLKTLKLKKKIGSIEYRFYFFSNQQNDQNKLFQNFKLSDMEIISQKESHFQKNKIFNSIPFFLNKIDNIYELKNKKKDLLKPSYFFNNNFKINLDVNFSVFFFYSFCIQNFHFPNTIENKEYFNFGDIFFKDIITDYLNNGKYYTNDKNFAYFVNNTLPESVIISQNNERFFIFFHKNYFNFLTKISLKESSTKLNFKKSLNFNSFYKKLKVKNLNFFDFNLITNKNFSHKFNLINLEKFQKMGFLKKF